MIITDGEGSGRSVGVSGENALKTNALTSSIEHHINHHDQQAYHLIFQVTPDSENPSEDLSEACFLYMKNTSLTDICIEGFHWRMGGTSNSDSIKFVIGDTGTPVGGTINTPANCNAGSGNIAVGTFYTGTSITGLSGGTTLDRIYLESSNTSESFNFEQDVIIPKNYTFTMYAETGGTEIDGTIIFNYHNKDMG